jgi:hypothetical protein
MPDFLFYGLWGLSGAFIYAAPKLTVCYFTARESKLPWRRCAAEFPVSLTIGAIGAAAISGWLSHLPGWADTRAVATLVGMVMNTVSPALISLISTRVIKRIEFGGPP